MSLMSNQKLNDFLSQRLPVLKEDDLKNKENVRLLEEIVRQFEISGEGDVVLILDKLERLINRNKDYWNREKEIYKKYNGFLKRLQNAALPFLEGKNIIEIIKNNLIDAIRNEDKRDVDIAEKIKYLLIVSRDSFFHNRQLSGSLVKAMRESEEILGGQDISVDNNKVKPYIKNWILDYENSLSKDKERGNLEQIVYINKSSNTKSLNEEERDILLKVLKVYDYLKFEFVIPDSYLNKKSIVEKEKRPEVEVGKKIEDKKPEETELQKKYEQFLTGGLARGAFEKGEKIEEEGEGELKDLRNKFYHAVNEGSKEAALAALLVMAEKGKLKETFGDDERFIKFWGGYLEKNNLDVAHFKNDPANGKDVAMFFKYILVSRLKMSQDEAVMIGMVISNLARRAGELEYQEMAYGDLEQNRFFWNS